MTIHYRQEFFGETTTVVPAASATSGVPRGLVGRQVANAEMLAALFRYSSHSQIDFLVDNDADAKSLRSLLKRELPAGKKAFIKHMKSIDDWMMEPKLHVIWEPQPPTASLSWTRSRLAPSRVALGGVTHALCSPNAVTAIRQLVTSPLRNFDRLVCTSEAVAHTARILINHWANAVGKAGDPELIQIEMIPLGVDCERHRPASPDERAEVRRELHIQEDADVVLFVGRLSHHAKSNPLPMFAACQRAASVTGRPVVLVLAGWYASDVVKQAFESEAARVAPLVTLVHVNAMDAKWRDRIWAVADLFVSLADSVQETFGLTVVEAMARGIAVVASDWNGYRETVQHERTGLLVPTTMIEGAGERALIAMHEDRLSYDHFLAAVGQTVCVSTPKACEAIELLLVSPSKRAEFGEAGGRRARDFSWEKIIARYERLWIEQTRLMTLQNSFGPQTQRHNVAHATYQEIIPPLRDLFDRYPTAWVTDCTSISAGQKLLGNSNALSTSPLAEHCSQWRASVQSIEELLMFASTDSDSPTSVFGLSTEFFDKAQPIVAPRIRSELLDTVAWAMKFDLLQLSEVASIRSLSQPQPSQPQTVVNDRVDITFTTTCMGRLMHLKQSLPRMVAQPGCHVVVIDYSCPDQAGRWVRENYSPQEVTVANVPNREYFDRSEAKNAAIILARTPWVCVIDADIRISDDFAAQVRQRLSPGRYLRRLSTGKGVGGTFVACREALLAVGMHDREFQDWGEEDDDLFDALLFLGHQPGTIPEELVTHFDHPDELRTQFHRTQDRRISHLTNRVYRTAKWDMAKINGSVPSPAIRRGLYGLIRSQVDAAVSERGSTTIVIPLGKQSWSALSPNAARKLVYQIDKHKEF